MPIPLTTAPQSDADPSIDGSIDRSTAGYFKRFCLDVIFHDCKTEATDQEKFDAFAG
jgi:hypothetical protein